MPRNSARGLVRVPAEVRRLQRGKDPVTASKQAQFSFPCQLSGVTRADLAPSREPSGVADRDKEDRVEIYRETVKRTNGVWVVARGTTHMPSAKAEGGVSVMGTPRRPLIGPQEGGIPRGLAVAGRPSGTSPSQQRRASPPAAPPAAPSRCLLPIPVICPVPRGPPPPDRSLLRRPSWDTGSPTTCVRRQAGVHCVLKPFLDDRREAPRGMKEGKKEGRKEGKEDEGMAGIGCGLNEDPGPWVTLVDGPPWVTSHMLKRTMTRTL
ncbi:hypothetical protein O3P69_000165 [Scylla paramamosain]|uniref:Uncharacterized protein n=1 Tax=Scylla paramamosain TaxID=85552 RepID=A0AAW0UWK4_SCYPA